MWNHLRAWRRTSSRTLQEVARQLGTTHTTVLRYEKGHLKVPNDVIKQLAEIYGCTPAELEFDPKDRKVGKSIHDAINLAKSMPPEITERWLEIGRLLLGEQKKERE